LAAFCALVFATGAGAVPKKLPALTPVADDALTSALEVGVVTEAEYALQRARSLFKLRVVRSRFGDVERLGGRAATLVLRDLALRVDALPPEEQRQARAILARPSDGRGPDEPYGWIVAESPASPVCDAHVCIHWVDSSGDAPPGADANANSVPDWVENEVQAVFATVWSAQVDTFGFKPPRSDLNSPNDGGNGLLDVYLADIGRDDIFGYCTSDDPRIGTRRDGGPWNISSYCVFDNDFADFAPVPPVNALRVTGAHEFRHASQFSQDWAEDFWLLEADATAIEDEPELYDSINDNRRYLRRSPLTSPGVPLDNGDPNDFFLYGSWIFARFLGENFGGPAIIREIWARADASFGRPDDYSMEAVVRVVNRRVPFRTAFARFARWNRTPARFYEEGAAYRAARTSSSFVIGPARRSTGTRVRRLPHLANAFYSFRPGSNASRRARLRLGVDLPPIRTRPVAFVLIHFESGAYDARRVALSRSGVGSRTVPFGRGAVDHVDLVLTNASARFDLNSCFLGVTPYSCGGAVPLDDGGLYRFRADLR
jgi:hypothetical protein